MKMGTVSHVKTSPGLDTNQINVDPAQISKVISLISKNIYGHPWSAFREMWLNARESVALKASLLGVSGDDQGQSSICPTIIRLPRVDDVHYNCSTTDSLGSYTYEPINPDSKEDDLLFYIRDFGVGMTKNA